ncbi:MAG: peptidoglycan recognition protein family protein, partial [Anaerovoracaceae bacterium]
MSNSKLKEYTQWSPNRSKPRNHKIDTITIHCIVGQVSMPSLGRMFADPGREASSNYGVGPNGEIGQFVSEANRAWTSSSPANDNRAVTIEVACDPKSPYKVNAAAMKGLIKLCADICKRNKIEKLIWKNDKDLIGKPAK